MQQVTGLMKVKAIFSGLAGVIGAAIKIPTRSKTKSPAAAAKKLCSTYHCHAGDVGLNGRFFILRRTPVRRFWDGPTASKIAEKARAPSGPVGLQERPPKLRC